MFGLFVAIFRRIAKMDFLTIGEEIMLKIVLVGIFSLIWLGIIFAFAYFDKGDKK